MCGIAGYWHGQRLTDLGSTPTEVLKRMADAIVSRGPDGYGAWSDVDQGVGLAHRRLAIVDLSENGRQPMVSRSGRYAITFNGEVYNFIRLRAELEVCGHTFSGHSDTEVMLAAIEEWGLTAAIDRFIGMFAFALWDRHELRMYLVRDRIGKKPLYYTQQNGVVVFGSELKALHRHPLLKFDLDPIALGMMLRVGYVPSPRSIYCEVQKVSPGHIVAISRDRTGRPIIERRRYWTAPLARRQNQVEAFTGSFEDAVRELDQVLRDAVALRMIADVPLGAFLSGGVDSSAVVALMQVQSNRPVRTFTIGFEEDAFNEADYARAVAKHIGTDHTELLLDSATARDVIPDLPYLFDEPFADVSQIPTFLVSKLARRSVTVALSGDGGDELFCGYRRYTKWQELWSMMRLLPVGLRKKLGALILDTEGSRGARLLEALVRLSPVSHSSMNRAQQLRRLAWVLAQGTQDALYEALLSQWYEPPVILDEGTSLPNAFPRQAEGLPLRRYIRRMGAIDLEGYLPDDILVKVDRASMGVSLEARAPLLDHRVVEAALRLPLKYCVDVTGRGKHILRHLAYRYVPQTLLDRPKTGFGVPIDSWLRGPLRQWAEDLLSESSLRACGRLRPQPIRAIWQEHLRRGGDFGAQLWNILMLQSWYLSGPARQVGVSQ